MQNCAWHIAQELVAVAFAIKWKSKLLSLKIILQIYKLTVKAASANLNSV